MEGGNPLTILEEVPIVKLPTVELSYRNRIYWVVRLNETSLSGLRTVNL